MAEENKDSKTEDATSKRVTDTEEKGNFAHSREVSSSVILLAAIIAFSLAGQQATRNMMGAWQTILSDYYSVNLTIPELYKLVRWLMEKFVLIVSPFLLAIMVAGVLANLIQIGGFRVSTHPLTPNFSKLNPLKGFGRIFSKNSLMELFKSLFKITVVSVIAYQSIKRHWDEIPPMMGYGVGQTMSFMGQVSLEIMIKVLMVMIFLALLDFMFQKFTYMENLRMTKQETKDERKETEGNPQTKQRIRTVQVEMARRRMMQAVPHADVVVTNPTHISVAIKYDSATHSAPAVVAKGKGHIAARIREIAKENNVPLVEDKPLARVLYKSVEVGQVIPDSLYKAVAEILAYVYKLKGRTKV